MRTVSDRVGVGRGSGLFFALAVLLVATVAGSARAAVSRDALSFQLLFGLNGHHTAQPVDYLTWCGDCGLTDYTAGSPWVENPRTFWPYSLPVQPSEFEPGCMWDSDDSYSYTSQGNVLAAGASVSVSECNYNGWFMGREPTLLTDVSLRSPSPDLRVTETWTWAGGSVTATVAPTFDSSSHLWRYFDCIQTPPPLGGTPVTVPGSHSQLAEDDVVPQLITVTVTNPTSQKVGKTGGVIEAGLINGNITGCNGSYRQP